MSNNICTADSHQMECIFNHDFVGEHDCVLACTVCNMCRHHKPWPECGTCGDVHAWEKETEKLLDDIVAIKQAARKEADERFKAVAATIQNGEVWF